MGLLLTLIAICLAPIAPPESIAYELTDFNITVSGTSSLHDWTSEVQEAYVSAKATWSDRGLADIPALDLRIPVTSIISTKGKVMDKKTWKALQEEVHPNIKFSLKSTSITPKGDQLLIEARGNLTVAGQQRSIELNAIALGGPGTDLQITGTHSMLMTDFGISPPKALLGTLKTGDEVTIDFDITLKPTSINQR